MNNRPLYRVTTLAIVISMTSSCTSVKNFAREYGTAAGCIGGAALAGGATYLVTKDAKKAIAGGLIGGIAGCTLGNIWQKREQALADIAKQENITITTNSLSTQDSSQPIGLVAQVEDNAMFSSASYTLTASGMRQVSKIAGAMKSDNKDGTGVILVVGHTDSTGSATSNQHLSELRAKTVVKLLAEKGISAKNLYFQGVGSSRPIATNDNLEGRAKNRRVEIVQVANEKLLQQRIAQEDNNLDYLKYSSATSNVATRSYREKVDQSSSDKPIAYANKTKIVKNSPHTNIDSNSDAKPSSYINFGGKDAETTKSIAYSLTPIKSGFSLINSAQASPVVSSCLKDLPRVSGNAKNLATGADLTAYQTTEFLPNMNGRAWAGLVNNNLVTLSPVAVLQKNAQVITNPTVYVTRQYSNVAMRSHSIKFSASANTWEGEDQILYRVYLNSNGTKPISCIDMLLPKSTAQKAKGQLFYQNSHTPFVADYSPVKS